MKSIPLKDETLILSETERYRRLNTKMEIVFDLRK